MTFPNPASDKILREHLVTLLTKGEAHADFASSVKDLPFELQGKRPVNSPHSPWEELEHMRIAQWDIVEYSLDRGHKSPEWPSGYWPETPAPPDAHAWEKSVNSFEKDLAKFVKAIEDPDNDLTAKIPHTKEHTLLRQALLIADHNAYHLGQLLLLRKQLGAWKE